MIPEHRHPEPAAGPPAPRAEWVHEDVGAAVEAVVPPRRVPLRKRAFWHAVFLLMRFGPTRRWLLRRYVR